MAEQIQLLTPEDVGRALQVKVDTVYRLLLSGDLKGLKVGKGKLWRVHPKDLQGYLEGGACQPQQKHD